MAEQSQKNTGGSSVFYEGLALTAGYTHTTPEYMSPKEKGTFLRPHSSRCRQQLLGQLSFGSIFEGRENRPDDVSFSEDCPRSPGLRSSATLGSLEMCWLWHIIGTKLWGGNDRFFSYNSQISQDFGLLLIIENLLANNSCSTLSVRIYVSYIHALG